MTKGPGGDNVFDPGDGIEPDDIEETTGKIIRWQPQEKRADSVSEGTPADYGYFDDEEEDYAAMVPEPAGTGDTTSAELCEVGERHKTTGPHTTSSCSHAWTE